MPIVNFGDKLPFGGSQYLKLKSKGDLVHFRLLGAPFIEGKHFFKDAGGDGWDIQPCVRVNDKAECEYCKIYFKMIAKAKKTGDKKLIEKAKKEAKSYQSSISVYYPVIDRTTEQFVIFQTTLGVRNSIEAEVKLGTKVLKVDFKVLRTETPGESYYKLSRVDSADTKRLTEKEKDAVLYFDTVNMIELVSGSPDESGVSAEANTEVQD